ncbi:MULTISPECIES: ATP-binding cassette domain-containing protein [Streptosporangium]|uniref:ATP-binding cassette subfamily C protein n=1 Tax=Streptosporangium brasiliense TaxID=47480 RepID=A0ABT9R7B1_9ACTN|nr:ATP-binding cassette domain-containing protein [Streptosporangium brasiliense]MDP9865137.1 ATP-binding cassette subfamily C protein [Streptosporangium brasiliense]
MPGPSVTRPRPDPGGVAARTATGAPAADRSVAAGLRLLSALLRRRRRPLAAAMAWSFVEAGPAWLSGLFVAAAVDRGFLAGDPGAGLAWLALLGAAMLLRAVATRLMFPHLAAVVEPLRDDLVTAVVTATVTRAAHGGGPPDTAAVSRLTEQVETVRNLVSALLRSSRSLGVSLLAVLGGLLLLSPVAAAVVAVPVLVALAVFARTLRVLVVRQRELVLAGEALTAQATPILAGLRDIAACGAQSQAYATVETAVTAHATATRALAWAGLGRRLVVTLGAHVPLLGLLVAARPLTENGGLSAGEVVGAMTYLATGLDPALRSLTGTVGGWGVALAVTLRRIAETVTVHAVPAPPDGTASPPGTVPPGDTALSDGTASPDSASPDSAAPPDGTVPPSGTALSGDTALSDGTASPDGYGLRAERLSFAYAPQATPVVRDLDLTVAEGEHLAVVGPSGIGKSTLSMLFTGLSRPTGGEIRLGGVPLRTIAGHELRAMVALVPQEAYVFTGTVRENLAYLCPAGTADARLRGAAEAVGAGALVERLGGLDAVIDGPSTLSAGERQLIALARAYASPARLVVLDEATCHLDPAAEAAAETAFAARHGTLIVIAHRISSARRAQRVLLMDGATVLTGSHHDLAARSPLYAVMVGLWQHDHGAPSMNG